VKINGANNLYAFTPPTAGSTVSYKYQSKGRVFDLEVFQYQVGHAFRTTDESGNQNYLEALLPDSYLRDGELVPQEYNAANSEIFLYQHDVDFDGVDELAVGIFIKDEAFELPNANSVGIAYFKLLDNHFIPLVRATGFVESSMLSSNELRGEAILGIPTISIVGNTVTIPRNLRGFYYKYVFETDGIKDVGEY
jgi:hypothetical protein